MCLGAGLYRFSNVSLEWRKEFAAAVLLVFHTVQILCIGTDRSQQTVQTKIRLLLKKQSDQG